jgi:hypothetical protein
MHVKKMYMHFALELLWGEEIIGTLTLKILSLCFWVITINLCFMTFDDI